MWSPHAYEKRIKVLASGETETTYFSLSYVFTGSDGYDGDVNELSERPISKSTYDAAKRRGGYKFYVSVVVPKDISVIRLP